MWDVDFKTAVSQAELEDRETEGAYHRIRFALADGSGGVEIETTRPELLPACVALVCHPDDERYASLVGSYVTTPLFFVRVPIVTHPLADPEKGSGIAMICTFGDTTDVVWWRELSLPTRTVIGRDGRLRSVPWGDPGWDSDDPTAAESAYSKIEGSTARKSATPDRRHVAFFWGPHRRAQADNPPRQVLREGKQPPRDRLEPAVVRADDETSAQVARARRELTWIPSHMVHRFEAWVEGLNGDWNISRQRFFGVPFPVWYPVSDDGSFDYDHPILASEDRLPVDPTSDVPHGFSASQRGIPGGFVGDPDVMDTWATSSLTPQIAGHWVDDPDLFGRVFPMDLRPQSHEIIRTWLFSTVVRSELEHGELPWTHVSISGWVRAESGKKMSKSIGNAETPIDSLKTFGSDAVRHWASSARPGVDAVMDEAQLKVGRRLSIKVLNASRFASPCSGTVRSRSRTRSKSRSTTLWSRASARS